MPAPLSPLNAIAQAIQTPEGRHSLMYEVLMVVDMLYQTVNESSHRDKDSAFDLKAKLERYRNGSAADTRAQGSIAAKTAAVALTCMLIGFGCANPEQAKMWHNLGEQFVPGVSKFFSDNRAASGQLQTQLTTFLSDEYREKLDRASQGGTGLKQAADGLAHAAQESAKVAG